MKLKYVGPHDEVEIDADYGHAVCKRGETVEVDDDLGKALLEQKANWVKATTPKKEARDGSA